MARKPHHPVDPKRLRGIRPFVEFSADERERLARLLDQRTVPAGTVLAEQGASHPDLTLILGGQASVRRVVDGEEHDLAVLGPGAFIGELGLLAPDEPASATVIALDDMEVAVPVDSAGRRLLKDRTLGPHLRATAARRLATNRVRTIGPVRVRLRDGSEMDLRPLWPDDWVMMAEGAARTSPETLYRRFLSTPKITETNLRRMATVDYVDDFAWVAAGVPGSPEEGQLVGGARYSRLEERPDTAEVALIMTDSGQGRGLGPCLLLGLAVAAEEHGITRFYGTALATNTPVRKLLSRAGATWDVDINDPAMVCANWSVSATLERLQDVADADAMRRLVRLALDIEVD
jgi:protein lysine acetyltransferase